jgi:hypothetical protein
MGPPAVGCSQHTTMQTLWKGSSPQGQPLAYTSSMLKCTDPGMAYILLGAHQPRGCSMLAVAQVNLFKGSCTQVQHTTQPHKCRTAPGMYRYTP